LLFDESSGSSAPQSFGAYRVLHQIGSGVLGPVFRSYDPQRDRLIAVKAFKLDIIPEDAQRLADLLRPMCDGPSPDRTLVRLLETGVAGSTAYVAMEFATGESLDVALRHLAPMPLDRALPMLEAVAGAIDTAWAGGVGHGALHPRDIIVAPGTLDVRVTGFGIRPALESLGVVTAPRRPYSAPERTSAQVWDERADVYSLAAIAHELLTGRRPLGAGEPEEATLLHRVLAKAMAPNPDDRFASARAFIDALDAVANSASDRMDAASSDRMDAGSSDRMDAGPLDPVIAVTGSEDPGLDEPEEAIVAVPDLLDAASPDPMEAGSFEPPAPLSPRRPDEGPLWAPFMTQQIPAHAAEAPRRYPYPWVGLAAMLLAGIALGATGTHLYYRGGTAPVTAQLPPPPTPADAAPARAETEVLVAPQTPPRVAGEAPPAAAAPAPASAPPVTATAPSQPETPVRAAAVTGRIVVRSVPSGALVTIDGRRAGETPLTRGDLPLGSHSVQVARRGYVPETRKVTLTSREPAQTVSVSLKAGAAQSAAATAPAAGATTGSIYADTKPRAARVVIDGRPYGTTPVLVPQLSPGTHTVRLEMDGYAPSSTSVTVRAGEQSRVSVSLVRR
jgi:serine/threonine-protein kinase